MGDGNKVAIIGYGALGQGMHKFLETRRTSVAHWDMKDGPAGLEQVLDGAAFVFMCVPGIAVPELPWRLVKEKEGITVMMSKGVTKDGRLCTEVAQDQLGEKGYAFLGGPMFAADVANGRWSGEVSSFNPEINLKLHRLLGDNVKRESSFPSRLAKGGVIKNFAAMLAGACSHRLSASEYGSFLATAALRMRWSYGDIAAADFMACTSSNSRNFSFGRMTAMGMKPDPLTCEGAVSLPLAAGKWDCWPMSDVCEEFDSLVKTRERVKMMAPPSRR